jgi:hypothetical protein
VSGTELSAATNATGGLARVATNLSDEEGRVAYAFEPPGTGTYAVNLSFGDQTDATFDVDGGASFDPGAPENVQVIVDGTAAGGGSGGASRATTLIDTSFENGVDGWSENVSGRATIANDTTTGADVVGSGYQSVRLVGPDPLAFESPVVDGAGFGYFDVEYWVKEGASGSGPERNEPDNPPEDLVFEYLDGDGTWQEADRVEATGEDGAVYERRVLIDSSAAAHGGLQVRFRRIAASGGDDWYVDDVRVYGIGSDTTGGSGSATGVALVDGSGRAVGTDSASVEFVLTNTGTADATVTDVAVDSTTDAQADVVDGGSTTVTTNRTGRLGGRIEVGGSAETFDTDVTLPAGEETVVTIGRFRKDNPGNDPPRRMSGDDVTLTLYFADGTTREYTVTAS